MASIQATGTRTLVSVLLNVIRLISILAWVFLVFGLAVLSFGLLASVFGGALSLPFMTVLAEDVPTENLVIGLISLIVLVPGVIIICNQLSRICHTLVDGDPFVPDNAPRLMRIAVIIGIMEVARYGIHIGVVVLGQTQGKGFVINIAAWTAVVALYVLSQVFSEGTRLREEEKMTI